MLSYFLEIMGNWPIQMKMGMYVQGKCSSAPAVGRGYLWYGAYSRSASSQSGNLFQGFRQQKLHAPFLLFHVL